MKKRTVLYVSNLTQTNLGYHLREREYKLPLTKSIVYIKQYK